MNRRRSVLLAGLLVLAALCGAADANTSNVLPWDGTMKIIADSLTGPVVYALGLLFIVAGFVGVAFAGAEMSGWIRWVSIAAILLGMVGAAPNVLNTFGVKTFLVP